MNWLRRSGISSELATVEKMIKKGELGEGKQKEAFECFVRAMRALLADLIDLTSKKK